ncbi:hypothetical protein TRAPUB_6195 [Trametes pubescens]|uniref:Fungal-type protein kinase domain-containing protein n=1 Tax=Trametes pubescens TaxID=154538 RepID=A0A1M2V6L6_TRAPU|nr:hypothetical protein TRAPUB_6195 [Trametes pubescens]
MGNTVYDPWDDRSSKAPENVAKSRASVRSQLIAYAKNVFLHQHRTALFSLLIIGDSFRAARWDRSGVIVSKKVNYVNDPQPLLDLICHLVQLDPTLQGSDPTATLIRPGTKVFRIMNELAEPNSAHDMDYMLPGTEDYVSPPAHPPPTESAHDHSSTPSGSSAVSTSQDGVKPSAPQPKTRIRSKPPARTEVLATEDHPEDVPAVVEAPDDDLPDDYPSEDMRVFRYVREKFRKSLADGRPRYKLTIKVGDKTRVFLVGWPVFESTLLFGRATRGYVAIDASTRRFVFLKDSWRPFYHGVEQEGFYLEKFAGDDSIIVPAIICHGDVGNQCAFTAQYKERMKKQLEIVLRRKQRTSTDASSTLDGEQATTSKKRSHPIEDDSEDVFSESCSAEDIDVSNVKGTLRHHIHYRLAVKDVCLPFEMFRDTEQLICLMTDCIETHHQVYIKHGLLHRDISAGNVLILPRLVPGPEDGTEVLEWRGVLTDWELAKPYVAESDEEKARQPERTGTWQFMSVAYINSQWTHPIGIPDELESFFHVLLFWALRFLPHTLGDTTQYVMDYFDTFRSEGSNKYICGAVKCSAISAGEFDMPSLQFVQNSRLPGSPLNRLINKLLELFKARYEILKYMSKQKPSPGIDSSGTMPARPRIKLPTKQPAWLISQDKSAGPSYGDSEHNENSPTEKTKSRAELLNTHIAVLNLFNDIRLSEVTDPAEWGTVWVVQDQLVNYEPRIILAKNLVPARTTGARGNDYGSNKRPRNAGSNFATSASTGQLAETT